MINIIFLFGTIAGLIVIGTMIAMFTAAGGTPDMSDHSVYVGYLIMIVALSMIFFGIKRYRDQDLGGVIKFLPAFLMGLAISAVAGVIYVAVWEVYLVAMNSSFIEHYVAAYIKSKQAEGLSGAELEKLVAEMNTLKTQYADPLFRLPMTFLEILPVGVIISLISAALLRNPRLLPARGG